MSKVYCGVGKIPKNHKKGSMKDCAEKGQIRLYGLYKVDRKLVDSKSKPSSKEKKMTKTQVRALIVGLAARYNRLKNEHQEEKNENKKKSLKKEMEETKKKHSHYLVLFKKMKDTDKIVVKEEKKQTKKQTKKKSKKN